MNKWIFGGIGLAVGLALGGGIGWTVADKRFSKRVDEEIEKAKERFKNEIENMAADLWRRPESDSSKETPKFFTAPRQMPIDEPGNAYTRRMNQLKEEMAKRAEDKAGDPVMIFEERPSFLGRASYTERSEKLKDAARTDKSIIAEEGVSDLSIDEEQMTVNNDQPEKDIFIITAEQFAGERTGFDKITLLWWEKNKLLTTEDYEILDVPDLIGTEWKDRIGEFEPDIVYVRNLASESDFEIVRQNSQDYYDYKE